MDDHHWMGECLRLARMGEGRVSPNPLVGAVLVRNGRLLAGGAHRAYGGPHAEIDCLGRYERSASGATLYVNLEPCHHHGKTGPCTEAILSSGISRVVVGMKDPNPIVHGKGIAHLRRKGVAVEVGVRAEECLELNQAFVTYMKTGLPFLHLKVASSLDGKLAGRDRWVTSLPSRRLVHRWRGTHDAVLVGAGTVIEDNPQLTIRSDVGRDPRVIVLDGDLRSPIESTVFSSGRSGQTYLCTITDSAKRSKGKVEALRDRGVRVLTFPRTSGGISFRSLFRRIAREGITSVLIEAGANLSGRLIHTGMIDRLSVFLAPSVIGGTVHGFASHGEPHREIACQFSLMTTKRLGPDLLLTYNKS